MLSLSVAPGVTAESAFETGVRLYEQKNYKVAADQFARVLQGDAANSAAYYYEALCFHQSGDFRRAKLIYQMLCDRFPGSPAAEKAMMVLSQTRTSPVVGLAKGNPAVSQSSAAQRASMQTVIDLAPVPDQVKVPFTRNIGGHTFVDCTLQGRKIRMLFDTGAEICFIGEDQLKAIGASAAYTGGRTLVQGATGSTVAQQATLDIELGPLKRRVPALVQTDYQAEPLLGQSFFKGFEYQVDNRGGFIQFINKAKGSTVPYDTIDIPFQRAGNNIVVDVQINGRQTPMFFDTGSDGIVLSSAHAALLGLRIPNDAQPVASSGVVGVSTGYRFRVDRIALGPILRTGADVYVIDPGPSIPLLGQSFIGDRRFTIDKDKNVIRFWR